MVARAVQAKKFSFVRRSKNASHIVAVAIRSLLVGLASIAVLLLLMWMLIARIPFYEDRRDDEPTAKKS